MRRLVALVALSVPAFALPLRFEANQGGFLCRTSRTALRIVPGGVQAAGAWVRFGDFDGRAAAEGVGPAAFTHYIGRRTGIPTFSRIRVRSLYPGIDAEYYGRDGELETDWIVAAGADPRRIRLQFSAPPTLDAHGDLRSGEAVYRRPVARQDGRDVPARYVVRGKVASIALGRYDRRRPLVIDPVLNYAGFPGADRFEVSAVDPSGNLYLAGSTTAPDIDGAFRLSTAQRFINSSSDAGQSWKGVADPPSECMLSLAAHPANPNILLSGGANLVCRSTDGGKSWSRISLPSTGAVQAVVRLFESAWDPVHPDILYAAWPNAGVIRSVDGGASWTAASQGLTGASLYVNAIAVDPAQPSRLYLSSSIGVFVSDDGASSWRKTLDAQWGIVAPDPARAGVAWATGADSILHRTADGGKSWADVANPFKITMLHVTGTGVIYGANNGGVFVSMDDGATWTTRLAVAGLYAIAGFPADPASVIVSQSTGIWLSRDYGATFTPVLPTLNVAAQSVFVAANGAAYAGIARQSDIFVAKYAPGGEKLLFATYFGGNGVEQVYGIAAGRDGSAAVVGYTTSTDFPLTPGAVVTAQPISGYASFASIIDPSGASLRASTLLTTFAPSAAAFDEAGGAYLAGVYNGKGALGRLTAAGFVLLNSLAGSSANSVAVDRDANVWVTGATMSGDVPVTAGAVQSKPGGDADVYLMKLSPDGAKVLYATYLGGNGADRPASVQVDGAGNAYVLGSTASTNFPVTSGAYQTHLRSQTCSYSLGCAPSCIGPGIGVQGPADLFVTKLNPAAATPVYSTYIGGDCGATPRSLAVDRQGNAFLAGSVLIPGSSYRFPQVSPFQAGYACGGQFPGIAVGLDPTGSRLAFSSYIDTLYNSSVASDGASNVYFSGQGCAASVTTPNARTLADGHNGYLVRLDLTGTAGTGLGSLLDAFGHLPASVSPGGMLLVTSPAIAPDRAEDRGMMTALDTSLGGVRVLFDDTPGAVMSVGAGYVYAIAPYSLAAGDSVRVSVESGGVRSAGLLARVVAQWPSLLDVARNEDGTVNSQQNPAARGSLVTVYATGLGVTDPPSSDGAVAGWPPARPLASLAVYPSASGRPEYVAAMPGFVNGVFEVKLRVLPEIAGDSFRVQYGVSSLSQGPVVWVK
ncbi:MAG: SBBP repeat-containing protein [Acidobacteria bacterium]|nr:SBBP repeat-containing protein [Acidobacteriota bacterium]